MSIEKAREWLLDNRFSRAKVVAYQQTFGCDPDDLPKMADACDAYARQYAAERLEEMSVRFRQIKNAAAKSAHHGKLQRRPSQHVKSGAFAKAARELEARAAELRRG